MEPDNVFKIAVSDAKVRGYLAKRGWEFHGSTKEGEMDSYTEKKSGRTLFIEDISDDFPVTFLMGGLGLSEFGRIAHELVPGVSLLEVDSSWEGRRTTIVVAMSEEQVRSMFGKRTGMRHLPVHRLR